MVPIASIWSRGREYWKNHRKNSSLLKCLADLATDDASLYSAEFSFEGHLYRGGGHRYSGEGQISYSLSVCKSPDFHAWCRPVVPPSTCPDPTAYEGCPFLSLHRSQSRIGDSDFYLQIAQGVGRIPGLSQISAIITLYWTASCLSFSSPFVPHDHLPCSSELYLTSILYYHHQIFYRCRRQNLVLKSLKFTLRGFTLRLQSQIEDDPKRIASFLGTNRSLKSLRFNLQIKSWAQILPALNNIMESFILSRFDATGSSHHKQVDSDLVLEKLELVLELGAGVRVLAHEALRVITTVLDYASLGFAVGEFWLSIKSRSSAYPFQLIMRKELGALVELHVPACEGEEEAKVVEVALRLNRGPSVLLLGPLWPPLVRKILSPLILDQNGQQANTCVSTLKFLNINFPYSISISGPTFRRDFSRREPGSGCEYDENEFQGGAP